VEAVLIVAAVALAVGAFAALLAQRADPEKAAGHELEPPDDPAYQPGDARPAGPDAEPMRATEGSAASWPEDPQEPPRA
jgi:hypothetical protein